MPLRAHSTIISGYAARLPGASTADAFWSLLDEGRCSVTRIGADRFDTAAFHHPRPGTPGRSFTFAAGQVEDVYGFDAAFFGISPREAAQIDPQQRLLLQVVWEAIETSGLRASDLAGTKTGVYVGASALDYHQRLLFDLPATDMQTMTGNTLSIVSNRISYFFDLSGPSFTVDTACSSSMVALHQAVSAIETGQIDTAIVAGVNLLLSPFSFIGFARASMLSPQGLCRAFDASGDGYVRSEGAVALVLQREGTLSLDRARARIVATGTNSDGRTTGLSLPSSRAQADLLSSIYHDLDLSPDDLAFIEAHGTGTQVGDPAEANALGSVIGQRRRTALPIGSVKTNVGHLEPVSGLVGVLKSILALKHDRLPRSLHFDTPNPHIDFDGLNLQVAANALALPPRGERPRLAGINSFGFGGTNAHAVIADMDGAPEAPASGVRDNAPLVISARSEAALKALAGRFAERLEQDLSASGTLIDASARLRDIHEHRLVVLGASAEKIDALQAFARDESHALAVAGRAGTRMRGVAFAFSGNGAQWVGMGRSAFNDDAPFAAAFKEVDGHFTPLSGWSLATMLFSPTLDTEIERTEVAQPLLFAIQVALVAALSHRGIEPDAVLGHSVGEVAAAWCSGMLDLETATRVIHARSTQQEMVRDLGGMAALLLAEDEARAALAGSSLPGLEISAINSPRSVTISGPTDSIDAFARIARKNRWAVRKLNIAYPFHSALVDPIEAPLRAALAQVQLHDARIPFFSSVDTDGGTVAPDAVYWWRNVRQPVRFADATRRLGEAGIDLVVEIGPKPILSTYLRDTLRTEGHSAIVVGTLDQPRTAKGPCETIDAIAARVVAHGAPADLDRFVGPTGSHLPDLPSYPWQPVTCRVEPTDERIAGCPRVSPLLGKRLRPESAEWFNVIDAELFPFLADHKVEDTVVFPAAGYLEMALSAALDWSNSTRVELCNVEILRPLVLDAGKSQETLVRLSPDDRVIEILARPRLSGGDWSLFVKCDYRTLADDGNAPVPPQEITEDGTIDHARLYELTQAHGLGYGPAFRRATGVRLLGPGRARIDLEPLLDRPEGEPPFSLDPMLADAGFHGLFALLAAESGTAPEQGFLPVRIGRLELMRTDAAPVRAEIAIERASARSILASFDYFDADDRRIARIRSARFKAVRFHLADEETDALVYRLEAKLLAPLSGLRLSPDAPSPMPDIAALAASLDLLATDDAAEEPSDEALLLDALARAVAHHALFTVLGAGPVSTEQAVAEGTLAASARPLAERLLQELAQHDLARAGEGDSTDWRLSDPADGLAPLALVETLVAEAGRQVAETTILARLLTLLPRLLREGLPESADAALSPALLEAVRRDGLRARALARAARRLMLELVEAWPKDRPLRILLAGGHHPHEAEALSLALDPGRSRLVVADASEAALARLKRNWRGRPDTEFTEFGDARLERAGPFDVAIVLDALSTLTRETLAGLGHLLTHDGLVAAFEPVESLRETLLAGIGCDWWQGPTGRRARSLASLLASAGLREVSETTLSGTEESAVFVTAKAPPHSDTGQTTNGGASSTTGALEPDAELSRHLVLLCSQGDPSQAEPLRLALAARGIAGHIAIPGTSTRLVAGVWHIDGDDASAWSQNAGLASASADGVVHLPDTRAFDDASLQVSHQLSSIMQTLKGRGGNAGLHVIVAPGGAAAERSTGGTDPVAAGMWAFGRVVMNEYPETNTRLVDPQPDDATAVGAARLADEIAEALEHPGGEREIVLRMGQRFGLRAQRAPALPDIEDETRSRQRKARRLDITRQGALDRLAWQTVDLPPLAGDEVEIEVEASGLNFRDVMWALGLLPEEALEDGFAGPTLGMECCGRIIATGPKATRFKPGERVIAFAPACFSSHVTVSERGCAPAPEGTPADAAATIPVTFLTSWYALVELARLRAGERVLIHGGAGGVGLAAIQIARHLGATVIATAGSAEKRALLEMLGADHVLDSRSLAFSDEVLRLTGGEGIEVVLNSLSGEAMERSLEVLKPFGRFLELGKRDYYENSRLGLRPFRRNLSYFGIDADQLLIHQPELAGRLLDTLMQLFANGTLTPLPYRVFEADAAVDAFRLMQQAGHIGKIVIRPPRIAKAGARAQEHIAPTRLSGLQVVAGGFGGFGAALVRRLADMGAQRIAVLSRRGKPDAETAGLFAELEERGVRVIACACDITDETALAATLETLRAEEGPVTGVFHTAMVINDALIANMQRHELEATLAPKIRGAQLLDKLTRGDPLRHFVLYSSATTFIGNPGQANYVAANGYLEGLAACRRAEGLPGLAVAWGAISDAGYLTRNTDVGDLLARKLGRHALSADEALDGLARLMALSETEMGDPVTAYARIDWKGARRDLALLSMPYAERLGIGAGDEDGPGGGGAVDLAALVSGLDRAGAVEKIAALLAVEIGRILRIAENEIDAARPLADIGMDSLMALELRMAAERQFGIDIPLMSLANGATLADMAGRIADQAISGETSPALSAEVRASASQHLDEASLTDRAAFEDVAARVEERTSGVKSLL
jgi:acyl transferase domain-containing protein/NADPH:quinone reductase-like Zn-dependent oxidoreductase/acyl carrier protein